MSKRETQTYAPEYRVGAMTLVMEQGLSVAEAVMRLNMRHFGPIGRRRPAKG